MQFSLENRTVSLSVGEFAAFALGPVDASGGPQGVWRAQLGQHWHNELRTRTEQEFTVDGALRPDVLFEVVIEGRLVHCLQVGLETPCDGRSPPTSGKSPYGPRVVAQCFVGNLDVAAEMVRAKMACDWPRFSRGHYKLSADACQK